MKLKSNTLLLTIASIIAATGASADSTVITMSNQAAGNTLEVYRANPAGALTLTESIPTGGNGLGAGLGSQGAIAFDAETRLLAAVNAGSNSISLFQVGGAGPKLINTFPSGGIRPVSVTLKGDLLFVANQGDSANGSSVKGFRLLLGGTIATQHDAQLSQAGYVNQGQISFSPNGRSLVVTEKATNKIDIFDLNPWGGFRKQASYNSSGMTPFGFVFDNNGYLLVSEAFGGQANASALSSYGRNFNGALSVITASAKTNQTAACWVALTPNGRYAFTTNAGSGTVSSFRVKDNGEVKLLGSSAAISGSTPIDAGTDKRGRNLFVLQGGASAIQTYHIEGQGALTALSAAPTTTRPAGLIVID